MSTNSSSGAGPPRRAGCSPVVAEAADALRRAPRAQVVALRSRAAHEIYAPEPVRRRELGPPVGPHPRAPPSRVWHACTCVLSPLARAMGLWLSGGLQ